MHCFPFFTPPTFAWIPQIYAFPLDERAAVCAYECEIDGVVTRGKVMAHQEAVRTYHAALEQKKEAQLLEQRRSDVFQIRVGNIKPRQVVTTKLTYVCETKIEGDAVRFIVPANVAPRYSPHSV